ncbi:MAG: hypothetical protein D6800_02675 [Candidatus Zixiibacteriota bacterium]|nr:MAG: hypothetical protein D6800_02675 [candidate division Zixibacteria bacterium]
MEPTTLRPGDFTRYHLPLIGFAVFILVVSSIPNLRTPEIPVIGLDKLAHLGEYAVLAFLAHRSFLKRCRECSFGQVQFRVLAFCLLFASFDEWHQGFIPGRQADLWDLAADAVGILIISGFWRHRKS